NPEDERDNPRQPLALDGGRGGATRNLERGSHRIVDLEDRRCDVGKARPTILREASSQRTTNGLWRRGWQCAPIRFALEELRERIGRVFALEGAPSRQHLEQDAAECPYIGALVD